MSSVRAYFCVRVTSKRPAVRKPWMDRGLHQRVMGVVEKILMRSPGDCAAVAANQFKSFGKDVAYDYWHRDHENVEIA